MEQLEKLEQLEQQEHKSAYSRRKFVALGAIGLASLAATSLAGCNAESDDTPPEEPDKTEIEPDVPVVDEELEQAKDDWSVAYQNADTSWNDLQDTITDAEERLIEFEALEIINPDALTKFESDLGDAKAVADQHSDSKEPQTTADLKESTKQLNNAADLYQQAESTLLASQNAVKAIDPFNSEFDITNDVGYSWHIEYSIKKPTATVDTTVGIPGEVGLTVTYPSPKVVITNTTSGKKAPGPNLVNLHLIFPEGSLSKIGMTVKTLQTADNRTFEYDNALFVSAWSLNDGLFSDNLITECEFDVGESIERKYPFLEGSEGSKEEQYFISEDIKDLFLETMTEKVAGVAISCSKDITEVKSSSSGNTWSFTDQNYFGEDFFFIATY